MAILTGTCKKCGTQVKLDIGELSEEEIQQRISDIHECPGHHHEINGMDGCWDVKNWHVEDGEALAEEIFLARLKEEYAEVLDTDEFSARGILRCFSYGFPMTTDGKRWDFLSSPTCKRYYVTRDKE